MIRSKTKFIELCCQIFSGEPEKTLAQINIERALRGEDQFLLKPRQLSQFDATAWVFGFVVGHMEHHDLVTAFIYGLNKNWFFNKHTDDYEGLIYTVLDDVILKNSELYVAISDYVITRFPKFKHIDKLVSIAYALSMTDLSMDEIVKLRNEHPLKK